MKNHKLNANPFCNHAAVIQGDAYRFTILTPALIRMEYHKDGIFEDRATQTVLNRNFSVPDFQILDEPEELSIYTEELELHYNKKPFSAHGLMIKGKGGGGGWGREWHYHEIPNDLSGTARTLDMCDGSDVLPEGKPLSMEHGILSRGGFSVLDDSHSMILTEDGWIAPRQESCVDLYFFGYGHRYLDALKDFYFLCGKTPLLPRYALGNWWSRYHRYTEKEYKELIERFEKERLPFSVAVIDMDWHLVDDVDPKYGSGWTGYTWNKSFFPDPEGFMDWLHRHNLKVTLNVHPADGIRPYEDLYPRVAKAMGIQPESQRAILFDPSDPHFMEVYFKELHHPLEEQGVDFWWLDWQQGKTTKIPGLDPLWVLNHYHFLDSAWKGTRPLTFSRYAGPGSHRYPIGFSGDTVISWKTLQFQPYFTSTASNIGYGWWSHDIGGHMMGIRDDELMARWIQYGVFSPITRLHSTDNPFNGKEPWKFDRNTRKVIEEFLRLRHSLIPYLYTMNRRASREGLPLIQPLYYLEPEQEEAYEMKNEYYFGSELLVSPITEKMDSAVKTGKAATWLPKGLWADFFTGMVYHGSRTLNLFRNLDSIPVLMKAGAIIPMQDMRTFNNGTENPCAMELHIFPAANGCFTLWEDDGDTPSDEDENWAYTQLSFTHGATDRFTIQKAAGNTAVLPAARTWRLVFTAVNPSSPVVTADGHALSASVSYDDDTSKLIVDIPETAIEREISVVFPYGLTTAHTAYAKRCFSLLEAAQIEYDLKSRIYQLVTSLGADSIGTLASMSLPDALFGSLCEILTA